MEHRRHTTKVAPDDLIPISSFNDHVEGNMHSIKLISTAALILACLPWAAQAETAGVHVTAQIRETCRFGSGLSNLVRPNLSFPEIDPGGTETFTRENSYEIRCTQGTRAQLLVGGHAAGPLAREMTAGLASGLRYQLGWTLSGTVGQGFGPLSQALTLKITGTLTPADYEDALAGHYLDSIPISLNP